MVRGNVYKNVFSGLVMNNLMNKIEAVKAGFPSGTLFGSKSSH